MGGLFKPKTQTMSTTQPLGALPQWAHGYAQGLAPQFQQLTSGLRGGEMLEEAQRGLLGTARGEYMDMSRNPALRGLVDYLQAESGRRGDVERAVMRERFGRLGPAFSADELKASRELERDISQRTTGQVSQMLLPIYEAERARQAQAAGGLAQFGMLPSTGMQNILRTLASMAGGQQTIAGPSKFQQLAQGAAAAAGAFGGE